MTTSIRMNGSKNKVDTRSIHLFVRFFSLPKSSHAISPIIFNPPDLACCCSHRVVLYCKIRKYAHPLHVKEGIVTEKVFPVFSESFFLLVLA